MQKHECALLYCRKEHELCSLKGFHLGWGEVPSHRNNLASQKGGSWERLFSELGENGAPWVQGQRVGTTLWNASRKMSW